MEESKVKTAEEENDNAFWTKQTDVLKLQSHITKLEADNKELESDLKHCVSVCNTIREERDMMKARVKELEEALEKIYAHKSDIIGWREIGMEAIYIAGQALNNTKQV